MKRTVILFPTAFLMNLNLTLINFSVIFFLKDAIGIEASTIGWFFAVGACGYVTGLLGLRPIQNRIVPPLSMVLALFISILSIIMIISSKSAAAVLVFYFLFSLSPAFYWPQLMGWFSYNLGTRDLSSAISKFNISWSAGALLGPLLGGFLIEKGLLLPFYVDIAVLSAAALLIGVGLVFIRDMRSFPSHTKPAAGGAVNHEAGLEQKKDDSELINDGRGTVLRFIGWIGVFSTYIVLGLTNNIFPLFIRDNLGFGESAAGNILFVRGITTAVGFFITGRLIFWHFNRKVMIAVQVISVSAMILLLFIKTIPGFYVLFILYGFLFSMAYSNGIFHGSAGALDRGRRMALFEIFLTFGVITGSIGGGYLYQYFSIYAAFIFSAAVIFAGLAAQVLILVFSRKKQ